MQYQQYRTVCQHAWQEKSEVLDDCLPTLLQSIQMILTVTSFHSLIAALNSCTCHLWCTCMPVDLDSYRCSAFYSDTVEQWSGVKLKTGIEIALLHIWLKLYLLPSLGVLGCSLLQQLISPVATPWRHFSMRCRQILCLVCSMYWNQWVQRPQPCVCVLRCMFEFSGSHLLWDNWLQPAWFLELQNPSRDTDVCIGSHMHCLAGLLLLATWCNLYGKRDGREATVRETCTLVYTSTVSQREAVNFSIQPD